MAIATALAPAPVRLTRRGRLVLLGLAVVLIALLGSLGRGASAAGSSNAGPGLRHVTVSAGETLWQVAERVAPQNDPRITVLRLMQLNGLSTPQIRAGQSLLLPAG